MTQNQNATDPWNTVQLVPPTPFSADGRSLNLRLFQDLIDKSIGNGIGVAIPAAGTGEFHSLTVDEAVAAITSAIEVARGRCKIMAPVGLGLEHALAVGERAIELGADALLVMPPVHPYLSDDGVVDYFHAIFTAFAKPLWVYKRGVYPSDVCLVDLAKRGVIAGVKYAVNDMNAVAAFVERVDGYCNVVCGTAERNAPFFHLAGARGFTSGAAILFPRLSLKLHAALAGGDYISAMKFRRILNPLELFRARQNDALNITAIKAGMKILGHDCGPVRPPYRSLTDAEWAELTTVVRSIHEMELKLT